MIHTATNLNTESANSQGATATQQTYEEQLAASLMAKNVAYAKEHNMPLWMLTGFPAQSSEPDEDDPIDFL
jgi:hypothetical protein